MANKSFNVTIKDEWCKACGLCIRLCPAQVLVALPNGKASVANMEACTGCRTCILHCPDYCVDVVEK